MENLVDTQHGTGVLLVGLMVIMCLHFFSFWGKFLFELLRKKEEKKDREITEVSLALTQNTNAVREFRIQLGILEREIADVQKFKINLDRCFGVVKKVAGDRWSAIIKEVLDEELK